jgi:lipopolysaccharide transport system permease protein
MTRQDDWLIVRATARRPLFNFHDLWLHRELALFLAWRDVAIRYKQTALGVLWVVLQPALSTVILTVIFGVLVRVPSGDAPYALFLLSGLLPWTFFASALTRGGASVLSNASLISKVYFPRVVIPISSLLSSLIDFGIVGLVTLLVLLVHGTPLTSSLLALPALAVLMFLLGLGVGLWLSSLNVQYRDVGYLLPFLAQVWFYATPVIYPSDLFPHKWRWVLAMNPMSGVVEGFRWALLGAPWPGWGMLAASTSIGVVLVVSGAAAFRRMERRFADVI